MSWSATSRPAWCSGSPSAGPSSTSPSCSCWTSRPPTWIPRRRASSSRCSGRHPGRTRVVVTHDVDAALAAGRPRAGAQGRGDGGLCGAGERALGGRCAGDLRRRAVIRRPSTIDALRAILAKDLRVELRTLQSVPAMALFAVTTFVLFRYGLDRNVAERQPGGGRVAGDGPVRGDPGASTACSSPSATRADSTRSGWRPWTARRCSAAKAAALVVYLLLLEAIARAGLRALLPRLLERAPAARRRPAPRRPRARGERAC